MFQTTLGSFIPHPHNGTYWDGTRLSNTAFDLFCCHIFAAIHTSRLVSPPYLGDVELTLNADIVAVLDLGHLHPGPSLDGQEAAHGAGHSVPRNNGATNKAVVVFQGGSATVSALGVPECVYAHETLPEIRI